jgi:hypothetical protein
VSRQWRTLAACLRLSALVLDTGCSPANSLRRPVAADSAVRVETVALRNVTVLPMQSDTLLRNAAVLIQQGRIQWTGPDSELHVPRDAFRIDGTGKTVLPGLIDTHAHSSERDFRMFLAWGVTTVREMNGSDAHLELRRRVEAGTLLGPRLIIASPLLSGYEWPKVRHVIVPSADSARALVIQFARAGYDFIKVYDGLDDDVYRALSKAAGSHGLRMTGHIPAAVTLNGVLEAGQSLEHVEKIAYGLGLPPDTSRIPAIVARIAKAGVTVVPTIASQHALALAGTREYQHRLQSVESAILDSATLTWWAGLARQEAGRDSMSERAAAWLEAQRSLLRSLYRAGVKLVIGTDTPNPLMVPGASVHDEIDEWIASGIPPYATLRAATLDAARYLGLPESSGTIQPGAPADLLVVDHDPRLHPATLRTPRWILLRGQPLDRDSLIANLRR